MKVAAEASTDPPGVAGRRIWYAIDDERRIVVLTLATVGHPASTD